LPTWAEWKFAAYGGQGTDFSGGDKTIDVGWVAKNSDGKLHRVAQKAGNDWGLFDMTGNAAERTWSSNDWGLLQAKTKCSPEKTSERVRMGKDGGDCWSSIESTESAIFGVEHPVYIATYLNPWKEFIAHAVGRPSAYGSKSDARWTFGGDYNDDGHIGTAESKSLNVKLGASSAPSSFAGFDPHARTTDGFRIVRKAK